MEIEVIKDDAKAAIIKLLNEAIQTEYSFIMNYPRIIDHLVKIDNIHDEQLIEDLEYLGKDSGRHLGLIMRIITFLGGEPIWEIETIDQLTHLEQFLPNQLEREKSAQSLYQQVKRVIEQNKMKKKVGWLTAKYRYGADGLPPNTIIVSNIINVLDSIIGEENHHIRVVTDLIATLNMLMRK